MATEPQNALKAVLDEVELLLEPLVLAADGPRSRWLLFRQLGWDIDAISGLPLTNVDTALSALPPRIDTLRAASAPDFEAIETALQAAGDAIGAVEDLDQALRGGQVQIPAGELAADLLNFLALRYLERRFPGVVAVLSLATLIDLPDTPRAPRLDNASGRAAYDGAPRPVPRFDRLPKLITDPAGLFEEVYWPGGITDQASADAAADRLLPRVAGLIQAFGGEATYGTRAAEQVSFGNPAADALVGHMLTLRQPLPVVVADDGTTQRSEVTLSTGIVGPDAADTSAGVVLLAGGSADLQTIVGPWQLGLSLDVTPGGLVVTRDGVQAHVSEMVVDAGLAVTRLPGDHGAALLIGSRDGTHIAIGAITMSAGAELTMEKVEPGLGFGVLDAQLVIKAGDGDGFLKAVLPPDGISIPFEFGLTWSPRTGVIFHGGATLEVELPVDLDLVILKVPTIFLSIGAGISPGEDPEVALGIGATVEMTLGPLYASVERMGMRFILTFPSSGGNLGPANLSLGFMPPKGASLSIDAGPVRGGGYLLADHDKGEYAGILHLEIAETISITAIGLLQTKFPDGSEGFSLVVIISAEFPPIQLGYGFTLNGVGGIVGINRAMDVPALQDGLRRGTIGSLLFPVNPIPRARQIIADVGAIFPPLEGEFVIGPMVKLGWGQGMITGTLAIVIQFPAQMIALLGRLQLMLPPVEEAAIVVLRLDFAGILDVPARTISLDGSLDGSRVAVFTITGDIAMRANFDDRPDFAMSAGGLHPAYQPPSGFPTLRRLTIALANSDNPRLRMEAYFGVTPATLQFGGHAEFYYGIDIPIVGLIELDAGAGFDALITFPSTFVVDIEVHVLLRRNGAPFIGVELDILLAGAQPLVLDGLATLHFLGTHDIPFHAEIGGEPERLELAPVDLGAQVLAALGDPKSWSAKPPPGASGVRLREADPGAGPLVVHPLGTLALHQTVAPLDVPLEKAGEAAIAGARRLVLTSVTVAGVATDATTLPKVRENFAVSTFFRLSDAQRLSQPAFELMQAGVEATAGPLETAGVRGVAIGFEDVEIPAAQDAPMIFHGHRLADAKIVAWGLRAGPAAFARAATDRRFDGASLGIAAEDDGGWMLAPVNAATVNDLVKGADSYPTAAEAFMAARGRDVVAVPAAEATP